MKRRSFLSSSATAVTLTGISSCKKDASEPIQKQLSVTDSDGKLAGMTLEELRDQYRYWLLEDYVPFHDRWVVDHEYGGFMLTTGWNGPTLSTHKRTWYIGRGIWTYSFLYNKIDANSDHMVAARKAVEFILKHIPENDTLLPYLFTREGKVLQGTDNVIYGDLFIANGLSEYSKASDDNKYWKLAKNIMLKCLRVYDTSGYYADAGKKQIGDHVQLLRGGARVQGHWFMLLRLCTQMLEFETDPEIEGIAARCIDAIMNHHYNPGFGLNNELLNHDFSRPGNDIVQYVSLGHSMETLWMIMYEAVRLKDKALFDLAAERFKRHLEVSWDDVYGGLLMSLIHVDKNIWLDLMKWAYVEFEPLIGLMCIVEHTGAQWAKDWLDKQYRWVLDKFPLKKYGLPLWNDYTNRKGICDRGDGSRRAENFHYPRHLMLNLLTVERMIKRNGKVSNVFT